MNELTVDSWIGIEKGLPSKAKEQINDTLSIDRRPG